MIYLTDEITIYSCSKDSNGVLTETATTGIKARIKDNNKIVVNDKGQEVIGQMTIMISKSNTVNYGDKIKVTKRWSGALTEKKYIIHSIDSIGGFRSDFIRIEI